MLRIREKVVRTIVNVECDSGGFLLLDVLATMLNLFKELGGKLQSMHFCAVFTALSY